MTCVESEGEEEEEEEEVKKHTGNREGSLMLHKAGPQ